MAIFTNQAFLTYNNVTTSSNIATGELVEVLSATKTAVVDSYTAGDRVAYVISILNTGGNAFTNLTVTDDLGGYEFSGGTLYPLSYVENSVKYYVDGVLQTAPAVTAGPPLVFTGISVPAGGNAILVYEALTNQFAPPVTDGEITNTVTVCGTGVITPVVATETITAAAEPELAISKSITPGTVTENSRVTYTFVIQNFGNTDAVATDDAVLRDTFDPILSDITVAFNGEAWREGTEYTYNEATGVFATVAGQITVPAATYAQDPATGVWTATPGTVVLTVTGTI